MHLILANQWYPPESGWGGVSTYNYTLAHALVDQGHHATVVAAGYSTEQLSHCQDAGVDLFRIPAKYPLRFQRLPLLGRYARTLFQVFYSKKLSSFLRKIEKDHNVDLVEFADINAEGYAYLQQKRRLPVVVRCHTPNFILQKYYDPTELTFDTRFIGAMEKRCIRLADALCAPSKDMAEVISANVGVDHRAIKVIANPVDLNFFCSRSRNEKTSGLLSGQHVNFLHIGRFERVKGIHVLAQAIPRVVSQCPEAHFIFAGAGGKERDELENNLMQYRLSQHVKFVGRVEQEEMPGLYEEADVAVVPSLNYESFSYTVAQAMAFGLPVVASRIGGIPETVGNGGAAILFEPGNVEQLITGLLSVCKDSELRARMGAAGRKHAEVEFSADVVAQRMLGFYKSVIS